MIRATFRVTLRATLGSTILFGFFGAFQQPGDRGTPTSVLSGFIVKPKAQKPKPLMLFYVIVENGVKIVYL